MQMFYQAGAVMRKFFAVECFSTEFIETDDNLSNNDFINSLQIIAVINELI